MVSFWVYDYINMGIEYNMVSFSHQLLYIFKKVLNPTSHIFKLQSLASIHCILIFELFKV